MKDKAKVLYVQSQYDVFACEQFAKMFRKPHHIICFHAQQAAEKRLKSLILLNGIKDKGFETHDIGHLLHLLDGRYELSQKFWDKSDIMTNFATKTRYEDVESYTDNESNMAVAYAKEICSWVDDKISAMDGQLLKDLTIEIK